MKLRLPNKLIAALMSAMSAAVFTTLASGTTAYGSTTYNDLTASDYFEANANVYNTGKGTFYLETETSALNLTLTLNLNDFAAYQAVHDYANAGYYSPFVTWTYNNNAGATYGMADVSSGYSSADYSGVTGMWGGSPWGTNNKITTTTLWDYADASGNVTLTINNTPVGTTRNVVVTAANGDTLYSADGLRSGNYVDQHITSFTVNMNYVKSVTLNSNSILDPSEFTAPKDYTIAFDKTRTESVGRIIFLGDSITHGVEDMSWRWGLFKTMVDNGIENEIAGPLSGYHSNPLNGDYNGNFSSSQYGGETFDNAHYAQSSGRTHNMLLASSGPNALGNSTGVNYGGVTSAKVGKEYNGDTYVMMMGTNDILSDGANTPEKMADVTNRLLGAGSVQGSAWSNAGETVALVGSYSGAWGTMGQIIDNMQMDAGDTMYVMSIPTWAQGRQNIRVYAPYVAEYNEKLKLWTKAYSDTHTGTIKYVDVNRGLVDKTLGGDFLGPDAFFRQVGGDYLHPNEQGALIIAGNLAQGMGLAGRTAGLHRADSHTANTEWVSGAASYTINAGQSVTIGAGELDLNGGYTVDFSANFGNGATNGWLDKSNALSISVGDGANVGTLKLSEGYISWGDKLLFCQDNSVQSNDAIRIAYHTGDTANQVGNGYYVWLGDMLIGQALSAGTGTLNGITLSSVGATGTVNGLTYSNTAYAPTSTGMASESNAFYATITKVMASHDSAPIAGPTDFSQAATASKTGNSVYAAASTADGDIVAKYGAALSGSGNWFAGQGVSGVEHTGNISLQVTEGASGAGMFGVVNTGTANGNVTVQVDGANLSSYTGGAASIIGAYAGNITGTFTAVMNSGTLSGGILGGFENAAAGNSIGSVGLIVNGGTVGGAILGGSKVANGTVGGAIGISVAGGTINGTGGEDSIAIIGSGTAGTVNGNIDITISGGVIKGAIIGKQDTGVTYGEGVTATVKVDGNKASITGNITADTVKLQNVAASEYSDGFDKYAGTITATNLVLDNYTAGLVNASLVTDYVTVSNGTNAIIRDLHLRNCSIDADATSLLTLGGDIHSGNTISYTGNLYLEDGISFTIDTPTDIVAGTEGLSSGKYIYKVADEGTGHLYSVDGSALTSAHTATFTGKGDLADKSFFYETATGALIAYGSDATYNITTSTVNYSDIPSAVNVSMSGGQLNLDTALNTGVTITATGGTVNVGEGVQFNTSALSGSGSAAIANNGGTVTLDNATATAASSLFTSITGDSGTMVMNQKVLLNNGARSSFGGTLIVNNANTDAYDDTSNNNNIKTGYDLVLGDNNTYNATADISSFSQVVLNNAGLYYGGNGTTINNLTLTEGSQSRLKVEHMASSTLTFAGETTLAANSTLTALAHWTSNVTFENLVGDGTLQLWGRNTTSGAGNNATYNVNSLQGFSGTLQFHKTVSTDTMTSNIATGSGKDVTIKGISLNDSNSNIVNITGAERLIVDGAVSVGTNGTLNIGNGTATGTVTMNGKLSGTVNVLANSTLTLGDTFSAESATIAGAGYVDVHMKGTDEKTYSIHDGLDGYLTATIDLTAYQDKVTFNNTGWKVDGAASNATFDSDTYKLSVAAGNVFYVNTSVNANEVTAPTGGGSAILAGNGTLTTTSWTLSNISVADSAWTGTVRVTNSSKQGDMQNSIANLANANSKVELKGVNGWFGGDVERNIVLTGTNDDGTGTALTINDGHSNTYTRTFTRSVEGHGDILFNWNNGFAHTVAFTGDISGWDGSFKTTGTGDGRGDGIGIGLKFAGDASVINAGVTHDRTRRLTVTFATTDAATVNGVISKGSNGGELKLVAENDVTFNNTVVADTLTATGHTITVGSHTENGVTTHGNLTLGAVSDIANLVINDGATVNATVHNSGTGFIKGTVNVNAGGTLNIVGDDRLGWGNNGTAAINMEGSEGKLATMTVSDKQTFSSTLNLNGYTNVINGSGDSDSKGLEIFQSDGHIGTINATGTNNTIAAGVFLRSKGTITTAADAELTISGDVKAGIAGGNAEMVKEGAGTLTLSGNNSFGGNLTVNAGTIVMGSSNALGSANNTGSRTITINSGATIDLHGTDDTMYKYTLAGGSLVNNGANTDTSHLQTMGLTLTDDSSIGGTGNFHLINSRYANTAVDLGGHTLTKTGSNTVGLYSTAISGAAGSKLRIEGGALNLTRNAGWNQTFTSLDADLEVAKSDSAAVTGEFIMAAGHSISSTVMGGSMNAAIQLAGDTTLSIDGVNNLTFNGVLSNAADATGSITKTGVGTAILNAANTYTGTTTIDAGALIASNSNALSHSVVSFSESTEAESPYRILAFAQNLSFSGATGALQGGTQIDGTIKGLDGHLGYVVANTLTIDVEGADETHTFNHRYDGNNQTSDRVEMKINRLVKTGAGTQIIGGDYSEARGFTTNGLVISHGVEVQEGILHMMTRGIVTTDFNVLAGATLKTSDEASNHTTPGNSVQYNGKVTLHGTTAEDAGVLFYQDGSTYTTNGLYVDGFGKVVNQFDKNQFINGLYNAEGTTANDLSFTRPDSPWDGTDGNYSIIGVTAAGDFAGTIHLESKVVKNNGTHVNENYGIQVLGTDAQNALGNALIDFKGDDVTVLSFRNANAANTDWANSTMDGAVGGLQGTNGAVYAETLTINTAAADADYTFGGALHVTNITKQGAGTQTINSDLSAFSGNVDAQGGTLVLSNHLSGNTLKLSGDGTTVTFNHADDAEAGTTFSSNIVANAAGGTLNVNGAAPLTANTISITAGTTLNFDQKVTLSSNSRPEMLYNNNDKAATYINFNGGYAYTGTADYALLAGKNVHITMDGTSNLGSKSIGFTGGASLTLKDGASLTAGQIYSSGTLNMNGTVNVGANATLTLSGSNSTSQITDLNLANGSTTNFAQAATNIETLSVGSGSATLKHGTNNVTANATNLEGNLDVFYSETRGAVTLGAVALNSEAATISTSHHGGELNITSLSGEGTLTLKAASSSAVHSKFNIGSSANTETQFSGTLVLDQANGTGGDRTVTWLLKDDKTAADADVQMQHTAAGSNTVNAKLALGAETVAVKSLSDTGSGTTVFHIAKDSSVTADSATLNITGDGNHTTAATVDSSVNIAMTGEGTQAFTGDMSAFDGNISVQNGELHVATDTMTHAKHIDVAADALLKLKAGASVTVNELVLGNTTALAAEGGIAPASTPAPVVVSDGDVNAHITVTGTQDEHGRIEVGMGGTNVSGTDLTVSGHVDYSAIPGNILNLNGGSLTLSTAKGSSTIMLSDTLLAGIGNTDPLALFTGVSNLTIDGTSYNPGDLIIGGETTVLANVVFANSAGQALNGQQYTILFRADGDGTGTLLVTPEPATTALSLLALSALAARRKRK